MVMIGGLFAGHDESGGNIEEIYQLQHYKWKDGGISPVYKPSLYKEFYGMSSKKANEKYSGGLKSYRSAEGREVRVPYQGSIENTIQNILGGIRSTMTYIGAKQIKHIPKCANFIRVNNQYNNIYERQ